MLLWEVIFLKKTKDEQKIMFSRAYEDGKPKLGDIMDKGKEIFINYISLFPAKDIQRISLGLGKNLLYSFYYIDKRFFDEGFLGAFGCAEYNTQRPYDWPEVELIAKFICSEYFKRLETGRLKSPEGAQEYIDWMDENILEYYKDFIMAKDEHYEDQKNQSKTNLANAFQTIASKTDEDKKKRLRDRNKKEKEVDESNTSNSLKLKEIKVKEAVITEDDLYWLKFRRKFTIMLLNSYGTPLTNVLTFINGKQQEDLCGEEDSNKAILESMTYSALNSFVGEQNLNLKQMKVRKPNDEGFEFVLFHTLKIKGNIYLIMMTVENFDQERCYYVGELRENEAEDSLELIGKDLKENEDWFDEKGQLIDKKYKKEIEFLFYRMIKKLFY